MRIRTERSEIELSSETFPALKVEWILFFTDYLSEYIPVDSDGLVFYLCSYSEVTWFTK